jgi:hypothetical protein
MPPARRLAAIRPRERPDLADGDEARNRAGDQGPDDARARGRIGRDPVCRRLGEGRETTVAISDESGRVARAAVRILESTGAVSVDEQRDS